MEIPRERSRVQTLAVVTVFVGLTLGGEGLARAQATPPAASGAPIAVPPPPTPPSDDALVRPYGILKAAAQSMSDAVDSFGRPNMVAPTAAGNPVLAAVPGSARTTFQAAQTRVGIWIHEHGQVRGQLEFDFVDFSKASPTVASLPRFRIAKIDYEFAPHHKLTLGQDWDLFSPLNPFSLNIVGVNYQAGNAAFMRDQFAYLYDGPAFETGVSVGFNASNNGMVDGPLELANVPSFAGRLAGKFGKGNRIGASMIATQLTYSKQKPVESSSLAIGGNLYAEFASWHGLQVKGEGYLGQNLGNLGLLTVGFGRGATATTPAVDIAEIGGWISLRQSITERWAVSGTAGAASVLRPSKVVPGYVAATPTNGTSPGTPAAVGSNPLQGLKRNFVGRLAVEYRPLPPLAFVFEGSYLRSTHTLYPADATVYAATRDAWGGELGALYKF